MFFREGIWIAYLSINNQTFQTFLLEWSNENGKVKARGQSKSYQTGCQDVCVYQFANVSDR